MQRLRNFEFDEVVEQYRFGRVIGNGTLSREYWGETLGRRPFAETRTPIRMRLIGDEHGRHGTTRARFWGDS